MKYTSQVVDFVGYQNGRGVDSIVDYYYASNSDIKDEANLPDKIVFGEKNEDGTVKTDGWWPNITDTGFSATKKYLWNFEKISFSSGEPTITPEAVISIYGKEIKEIAEFYLNNNSEDIPDPNDLPQIKNDGTIDANGWTKITKGVSVPVPSNEKRYLWNYEVTLYTDGTNFPVGPACVAV
jgi:hypothetical protein